jgi:hypothetical protein
MSTAVAQELTLADVLHQLGGISPRRIRFRPAPGTATEDDVIKIHDRERRLFELVDGVLVGKVMGYWESVLATELAGLFSSASDWAPSQAKRECFGCLPASCVSPTCRSYPAIDWRTTAALLLQFFHTLPILLLKC